METSFLPLLFGGDINVYSMAPAAIFPKPCERPFSSMRRSLWNRRGGTAPFFGRISPSSTFPLSPGATVSSPSPALSGSALTPIAPITAVWSVDPLRSVFWPSMPIPTIGNGWPWSAGYACSMRCLSVPISFSASFQYSKQSLSALLMDASVFAPAILRGSSRKKRRAACFSR